MTDYIRRLRAECERAEVLWAKAFRGFTRPQPRGWRRSPRPDVVVRHEKRREEYRTLINAGGTALEIAAEMKVTAGTVYSQAVRLGLDLTRPTTIRGVHDSERDKRIREMCVPAATAKEIAAVVGMTIEGLRNRCIALGVEPRRERARRGETRP